MRLVKLSWKCHETEASYNEWGKGEYGRKLANISKEKRV